MPQGIVKSSSSAGSRSSETKEPSLIDSRISEGIGRPTISSGDIEPRRGTLT